MTSCYDPRTSLVIFASIRNVRLLYTYAKVLYSPTLDVDLRFYGTARSYTKLVPTNTMCKYTHGKRQDSLLRPKVTHYRITDDYRSIIKDLRTENKRLKGELRWYRQRGLVEMRRGPLFEITAHMLSTRKKRELEALLHDFMLNITGQSGTNSQPSMLSKYANAPQEESPSSCNPPPFLNQSCPTILAYAYHRNLSAHCSNRQRTLSMLTFRSDPQCIWDASVPSSRERGETGITVDGQMDKIIAEGLSKDDGSVCDQASCT